MFTGNEAYHGCKVANMGVNNDAAPLELVVQNSSDKNDVLAAVKQDGLLLELVNKELQGHPQVIKAALEENPFAIEFVRADRRDVEMFMRALKTKLTLNGCVGNILVFGNEEQRAEKPLVLAAVERTGEALSYASKDLRADREIVLAAVKQDWKALRYASTNLRDDKEVVLAAVQADASALQYASETLQKDSEILRACNTM